MAGFTVTVYIMPSPLTYPNAYVFYGQDTVRILELARAKTAQLMICILSSNQKDTTCSIILHIIVEISLHTIQF